MKYILKSSNISNNIINLKKSFKGEYSLYSFCFTNNIYNITSNNNILPYQQGASYNAVELTQQFTNGQGLASDIQSKLNAIPSANVSVSYNSNTGKFTITNTTNFYLKFGDITTNICNELLGFNGSNTTDGLSVSSDTKADLTPFKSILINIKEDKNRNVKDENYNQNTFVINGDSNFGEKLTYKSFDWDVISQYMLVDETKRLEITFTDEKGNSLDLRNWVLVLEQ